MDIDYGTDGSHHDMITRSIVTSNQTATAVPLSADELYNLGRFGKPRTATGIVYRELKKIIDKVPPTPMLLDVEVTRPSSTFNARVLALKTALDRKHQFINRAARRKAEAKLRKR
jgi:hypothetical protein